ncbi:hypothetical protein GOP47_0013850 [Adiantum capillus-veneris]|uniref:SET domain-containing protein n=1 Tax=Adiantum capillus-veneris TaxID=13818 RepID=A0A9D4UPB0_ADICA|nr:hypothetical protein GOP47_0013850 [Adiantum capillus-veneris]
MELGKLLLRARMMLDAAAHATGEDEEEEEDELVLNLEYCSKDNLVRAHDQLLAHLKPVNNLREISAPIVIGASEAATSSRPLRGLRPIHIRNLQVNCHHQGRVLYGELCVEPLKMVAVQTIVLDEAGHAAKLSVYNALPNQHFVQKMGTLFRKGLKVAIKEPYFKVAMDGSLIIRVDNPADFVRNPKERQGSGISDTSAPTSSLSPLFVTSSSPDQPTAVLDAHGLRVQGNQAFAAQDWKEAIRLYGDALKILLQYKETSSFSPSALSMSQVTKELVLGFSNRAEARLRLKHFEAAERDARKALQLQKNHVKSCSRRGRALHGLHLYKEAALCFKIALLQMGRGEDGMSVKDLRSALQASEICERQAKTGQYDLLKMWREVEQGREPLCGEYIGPVEIGPARERSLGRGLLVTRDVEPGDLLMVSKAVAHAEVDRSSLMTGLSKEQISAACTGSKSLSPVSSTYHDDLAFQIVDRALSSKRFREQVNNLSSTDASRVENNIPDMDLFVPKLSLTEQDDAYDVEEKVNLESFDMESIRMATSSNALEIAGECCATLWLLPSFINHSCVPNAWWVKLGKEALFVRAVRHLSKGQEVLISYLDNPALPLSPRASFLQHCRGFECRCERCSFENTMEPFLRFLENDAILRFVDMAAALEVVKSLEWAFNNVTSFEDEKKKQWLRTSYLASYTAHLDNASFLQTLKDIHPLETIVRATHETLGGSELLLNVIRQRVDLEECSPYVRGIVAGMSVCLYGKQAPAALTKLVALRGSMLEKAKFGLLATVCAKHEESL